MTEVERLIRFIQNKKPVPRVGAGLSIDAGFPKAGALADTLRDRHAFDPRPPDKEPYALIDAFYRQYGKGSLAEALSEIIPAGVEAGPSHDALARIVIPKTGPSPWTDVKSRNPRFRLMTMSL